MCNTRKSKQRAGAMFCARLCFFTLLAATPARAGNVAVTLDEGAGTCSVHGSFAAPVGDTIAWQVLSDYDHIPSFVSTMVSSHTERDSAGRMLVHQVAVGGVFLFHRRVQVTLGIEEEAGRRIRFYDVQRKDFESYVGEWEIQDDPAGVRVTYWIEADPRGAIARAFCRHALRGMAEDLLEQVRAEMLRRDAGR